MAGRRSARDAAAEGTVSARASKLPRNAHTSDTDAAAARVAAGTGAGGLVSAAAADAAETAAVVSETSSEQVLRPPRISMRLHVVRSSAARASGIDALPRGSGTAGEAAATAIMDSELWRRLPEDALWKVVMMVPATKRIQLQLVSREWRRVLTSAQFRDAVADHERSCAGAQVVHALRVSLVRAPGTAAGPSGDDLLDVDMDSLDVDLSFVPRGFWGQSDRDPDPAAYSVLAAGDGLVCLVDARVITRLCVINPVTRTCTVVPAPPSVPAFNVRLQAGAISVLGRLPPAGGPGRSAWAGDWAIAWYDLEAPGGAGEWAVAHGPGRWQLPGRSTPCRTSVLHWAACGGEWYCYRQGTVTVHAVSPAGACSSCSGGPQQLVVAAEVATPWPVPPRPLDVRAVGYDAASLCLVAAGGRVFFLALADVKDRGPYGRKSFHVWALAREAMEWRQVAEPLDTSGLTRLPGFKYAYMYPTITFCGAYAAREDLVCFDVLLETYKIEVSSPAYGDDGSQRYATVGGGMVNVRALVGLHLVTREWEWELLHDVEVEGSLKFPHAFALNPNLFLSST